MSRKIFRMVASVLIPVTVLAFITADQYYRAAAHHKAFPGILLESFPGRDIEYRPSLISRLFFREETDAVNLVLGILEPQGIQGGEITPSSLAALVKTSLPLPLMMYKAFAVSDLKTCLRLASIWNQSPSGLFQSAAALEQGNVKSARETWESLLEQDKNVWLGNRILRQLNLAESYGDTFPIPVFDRRGIPLGHLNGDELKLSGENVSSRLPLRAMKESLQRLDGESHQGIRSSIDLKIQDAAVASLEGYRGSIVVIDSHTGEILAAASDEKTLRRNSTAPFSQQYEPASISKLITSSAALRAGINVDEFMENTVCNGGKRYSGKILWCSYRSGRLGTLAKALADSCNIAFADLGVAAGRKALLDELTMFGFDRPDSGPFHFGKIVKRSGDSRQLADLSIGLESTTITPVHAALLAATFANNGIMPEPTLLTASDGILGLSPYEFPRPPGSWILNDPEALEIIGDAMREVALNGTARGMSENGFPVAMKTGTGRTSGTGYVTNYVGYGPLPDTRISFCIRITHQSTSSRVGRASRAVLADFLHKLSELEITSLPE